MEQSNLYLRKLKSSPIPIIKKPNLVLCTIVLVVFLIIRPRGKSNCDEMLISSTNLNSKTVSTTTAAAAVTVASGGGSWSFCIPGVTYRAPGMVAIQKRNDIGKLLQQKGFETGAEVGVQQGLNTAEILKWWKSCQSFALVDLWAKQPNYNDYANEMDHEHYLRQTKKNLKSYEHLVSYYRMKSIEAPFANYSLDFVYLDARHDYCAVMEDLEYYWPLVRPGGIVAGHDYITQAELPADNTQDWSLCQDGTRHPGAVRGAVEEFAMKQGVTISVTYNDREDAGVFQNWLMQKPSIAECVQGTST